MHVWSYMITKNEVDRYLFDAVEQLMPHVDGLFIYDDRSEDLTVTQLKHIASMGRVDMRIRMASDPSFAENESAFRQEAWKLMEKTFTPRTGDWILTLDADEFLRTKKPIKDICETEADVLRCKVWEIWDSPPPQVRVDGFWNQTTARRLIRWEPNMKFLTHNVRGEPLPMGTGSIPTTGWKTCESSADFDILHYGYARQVDRQAKFDRYKGKKGHSPRHIKSILMPPMLAPLPPID